MNQILKSLLKQLYTDIDTGNSSLSEEDTIKAIKTLKEYTSKETVMSKYSCCQYLNISRASFDNYIRAGKIPRGIKKQDLKNFLGRKRT